MHFMKPVSPQKLFKLLESLSDFLYNSVLIYGVQLIFFKSRKMMKYCVHSVLQIETFGDVHLFSEDDRKRWNSADV